MHRILIPITTHKLQTSLSTNIALLLHREPSSLSYYSNMLLVTLFLAGVVSAALVLDTTLLGACQVTTEFIPWEITAASAYSNGCPNSSPPTLDITIKQPNTIRLQRVPRGYGVLPAFEAKCEWG